MSSRYGLVQQPVDARWEYAGEIGTNVIVAAVRVLFSSPSQFFFIYLYIHPTTALAVAAVAFGDMIIHCSRRNASAESADFAGWLTIGLKDSDFHGLIGLLSYADDSDDSNALTAAVASWAQEILSGAWNQTNGLETVSIS